MACRLRLVNACMGGGDVVQCRGGQRGGPAAQLQLVVPAIGQRAARAAMGVAGRVRGLAKCVRVTFPVASPVPSEREIGSRGGGVTGKPRWGRSSLLSSGQFSAGANRLGACRKSAIAERVLAD